MIRRVIIFGALVIIGMAIAASILSGGAVAFGVLAGGTLIAADYGLIALIIDRLIKPDFRTASPIWVIGFFFKLLFLGAVLYYLIAKLKINGLGIILGFTGFIFVILTIGLIHLSQMKKKDETCREVE